jgi:putative transposase
VSRYRFIAAEKASYPVAILCRVLGVSRASFYAWHDRSPSIREQADQQLLEQITRIHRASRGTYGAPRVHAELRDDYGVRVGRKRVARLMRTHGLVGCHRRRRRGLTRPDPAAIPAPDLVGRLFDPGTPDRTWYADISYIPTQEGWLYLAAVLDGCSRKVVGWAMADHLRAELVHTHTWPTHQAARTAVYEYIEVFYNRRRRHSALGYLSPTEYERRSPGAAWGWPAQCCRPGYPTRAAGGRCGA